MSVERLAVKAFGDVAVAERIKQVEDQKIASPDDAFARALSQALNISREELLRCRVGLSATDASPAFIDAMTRIFRATKSDPKPSEVEAFVRMKLAAFQRSLVRLSRIGLEGRKQQMFVADLRQMMDGARFDEADAMLARAERLRGPQTLKSGFRLGRGEISLIAGRPKVAVSFFEDAARMVEEFARDDAAEMRNVCAGLLHQHSRMTGDGLGLAAAIYRKNLHYWSRLKHPEKWAMTQNNLAITQHTMAALGRRGARAALLSDAVDGYRAALAHYTRLRHADTWATIQGNLADALTDQAKIAGGAEAKKLLEEAVQARRAAQEARKKKVKPADWAEGQCRLARTLSQAATASPGDGSVIREAVEAERQALDVYGKDTTPLHWAATQNNLGIKLRRQAGSSHGVEAIEHLAGSMAAFRRALEIYDESEHPSEWRMVQHNLALSALMQARQFGDASAQPTLQEAREACKAALRVTAKAEAPEFWARVNLTLSKAMHLEGSVSDATTGVALLRDALKPAEDTLGVLSKETQPGLWAEANRVIAAILEKWADFEPWEAGPKLKKAKAAVNSILTVSEIARSPGRKAAIKRIRKRIVEKSLQLAT